MCNVDLLCLQRLESTYTANQLRTVVLRTSFEEEKMAEKYIVQPYNGLWQVAREQAPVVVTTVLSQQEAIQAGKLCAESDGAEVVIQDIDGATIEIPDAH